MSVQNENNKEELDVRVDVEEVTNNTDDEVSRRINKLYGISTPEDKKQQEYDPKKLEEVRKKILFLLVGVVLTGVIILFLLINTIS